MTERYSFTVDRHLVSNLSVDGSVVWSQDNIDAVNSNLTDTINEGYVTAEDETQYLSVLDSTNEISLENLNITLNNPKLEVEESVETFITNEELIEQVPEEVNEQNQVVVYSVEGSDELFGIQIAQDEEGNLQKYQFQFRRTKDGQLEAIPETIQLLPMDEEVQEIQETNLVENLEQQREETVLEEPVENVQHSMQIFVQEDNSNEHILPDRNVLGEEQQMQYEEETIHTEEVDVKPGFLSLQDVKQEIQDQQQHQRQEIQEDELDEEASEEALEDSNTTLVDYNEQIDQNSVASEENSVVSEEHPTEDDFEHVEVNPDLVEEQMNESDLEDDNYHIVEGVHITGDVESAVPPTSNKPVTNSNILRHALKTNKETKIKKSPRFYMYVVQHPEKENVDSLSMDMANLCKPFKTNPRSILKSSVQARTNEENERLLVGKRFARCKEAVQARNFHNFINKTTIPQAPVRKDRLPRKQKIKPVERMDEEIVVQEVMVSNNGFVESTGIVNKENLAVTEYVELTDSDDDYDPKKSATNGTKKKKKRPKRTRRIEITISDDDSESETASSVIELDETDEDDVHEAPQTKSNEETPTKRRRGRPPKNRSDNSESPSKRSRPDEAPLPEKPEIPCPKCDKTFPSQNSLKTHLQHHNLQSTLKNASLPPPEYKYKCDQCSNTFKNSILLKRHACSLTCSVCKRKFQDQAALTSHRRTHAKERLLKTTSLAPSSPANRKSTAAVFKAPPPPSNNLKCKTCGKLCSSLQNLSVHTKSHKEYTCATCSGKFLSQLALEKHLREKCVKSPRRSPRRSTSSVSSDNSKEVMAKVQCDKCTSHFYSLRALFTHNVKQHGLETPDKSVLNEDKKKKTLYKEKREFSGIPPAKKLQDAYAGLRSRLNFDK